MSEEPYLNPRLNKPIATYAVGFTDPRRDWIEDYEENSALVRAGFNARYGQRMRP